MDTNRERVLQCIIDLKNDGRPAARPLIAEIVGLKLSKVDEAVKRLKEDGLIRPIINGVFEPVEQHPPDRPFHLTPLPDGRVRLEVDDDLIEFTPGEAQRLGRFLYGLAMVSVYREESRVRDEQVIRMEMQIRSLQRQLQLTQRRMAHAPQIGRGQADLFQEPEPVTRKPLRRGAHVAV